MNLIKKRMIWFSITAVVGLLLLTLGTFYRNENTVMTSMGFGLAAVSIIRLVQYLKIQKDPKLKKQFELKETEERMVFIANKSRSLMFALSVYLEFLFALIAMFINRNDVATVTCAFISLQLVVYCGVYFYYNRKY